MRLTERERERERDRKKERERELRERQKGILARDTEGESLERNRVRDLRERISLETE